MLVYVLTHRKSLILLLCYFPLFKNNCFKDHKGTQISFMSSFKGTIELIHIVVSLVLKYWIFISLQ